MIRVKFFAQDLKDKSISSTNELFFDELNIVTTVIINTQYERMRCALPNCRVMYLIENLEE